MRTIWFNIKLYLWIVPRDIFRDIWTWYACGKFGHKLSWARRLSGTGEYCAYEWFPICSRCLKPVDKIMEELPKKDDD